MTQLPTTLSALVASDPKARAALEVVRRLREAGFEAYWAGGCVRDLLLGRVPKDYDVVTSARPEQVQALFARTVPVGAAFGVVQVLAGEAEGGRFPVEVATFRTEGPYADGRHPSSVTFADAASDAGRRDFTVNALFLDPVEGRLLDWVGGLADLRAGVVRTVGDPDLRFSEDRLRVLRAVRLACELGFRIDSDTWEAIRRHAAAAVQLSPERVRDELVRMFTGPRRGLGLRLLDTSGLLEALLPEVAALKGVEQPPEFHPEGDVFEHTVRVLDALQDPSAPLAFGALLHDAGKPATRQVAGRVRFPRHDEVGARIAEAVLRRLRFSNHAVERVVFLVREHMRIKDFPRMREAKRRRLAAHPGFPELVELLRADCVGSHGDLSVYEWIQRWLVEHPTEALRPPRLVTGHDLIAMGFRPGPLFGEVLEVVYTAQLEGRVHTREEALQLAAREATRRVAKGEGSREVEPQR